MQKSMKYPVALALLVLGVSSLMTVPALGQEPGIKEAIALLREALAERKSAAELQQKKIAELEKNRDFHIQDNITLEKQVAALQGQVEAYKEREKLWLERLNAEKQLTANANEGIKARDKVITELSKGSKTSTWQKIAESVVPVASIIGIVAASN